ncbi:tetratricopeptide repeat protein [Poriferisphaera sp. WC338]|uniref:tetratricopeptide repeat protein n=1 Tax=Poriferisphaera sp. WC338 TaxID=3425129 RepID=UPI003D8162AA
MTDKDSQLGKYQKKQIDIRRKLIRLSVACRSADTARAELELHDWIHFPGCPAAAHIMLASLLARRSKLDDAKKILNTYLKQTDQDQSATDPQLTQLLISILISSNLLDAARRLGKSLYQSHGHHPPIAEWLRAMSVPGSMDLPIISPTAVDTLANQLSADTTIIPTLIYALKHNPKPKSILLLRQAIGKLADRPTDTHTLVTLTHALAELAILAGDHTDARRWTKRGLDADPYNATLALLLAKFDDPPETQTPARKILSRVARKFPHYPDVKAALIHRAHIDGKRASAQRKLAAWLKLDPNSPTAKQLSIKLKQTHKKHYEVNQHNDNQEAA